MTSSNALHQSRPTWLNYTFRRSLAQLPYNPNCQTTVDTLRTRNETIKAGYTAAEAQAKVGETLSGLSEDMGDIGLAVQRAEDKTQALQARSGAIDGLLASGALDDLSMPGDQIEAELGRAVAASQVDAELARIKAELPPGRSS